MDPDLDQRLRSIEKKLDENSAVVEKLHKNQQRARTMKFVYWGIVILLSIVSLSLIKPYLSQLGDAYGLGNDTNSSSTDYSDLLKTLTQ